MLDKLISDYNNALVEVDAILAQLNKPVLTKATDDHIISFISATKDEYTALRSQHQSVLFTAD